ncbi:hypothetical protein [Serratia marcescens]|uniref:hypothetical protein n=1 Tax=Serratia marcescens TaxID=615 RepID=UPI0011E76DF2|nr:hypothetical protein [Serratia marcescens]
MNRLYNQPHGWEDYLGDTLRGNVPVNQLIPQHPYLLDTLRLEEVLHKNTEHIMLLTSDEAYAVVEDLYNKGTNYAGNIKDSISGAKNITKLITYHDAGKLVFNLKGLGIKAQPYLHKGVTYIKITGYPSVRRILNGTRYSVNNPKILELGIGKLGINMGILSGALWCVYFSAAQRIAEFIFSSEHDVATFIGNISIDVAKVIVSMFMTKIITSVTALIPVIATAVLPISGTIMLAVFLGVIITVGLHYIDKRFHLSQSLIESISHGMTEHQRMIEWNVNNSNPLLFSISSGLY